MCLGIVPLNVMDNAASQRAHYVQHVITTERELEKGGPPGVAPTHRTACRAYFTRHSVRYAYIQALECLDRVVRLGYPPL